MLKIKKLGEKCINARITSHFMRPLHPRYNSNGAISEVSLKIDEKTTTEAVERVCKAQTWANIVHTATLQNKATIWQSNCRSAEISGPLVVSIAITNWQSGYCWRSCLHASRTFGRDFDSAEDLFAYVAEFKDIESLVKSIADEKCVLFNLDDEGTLEEKISAAFESEMGQMIPEGMSAGTLVAIHGISRMGQATDVLMKSTYLGGTPLIQAETSWQYFKWKLEYNSVSSPDNNMPMHMSQGLMRASETDEVWLKNIPVDALIEMRTSGSFEEVRNVLSQGVSELAQVNPSNFFRTSDQIVDNIRAAFDEHQAELKRLTSRKIKFAGYDIGAMVGAAALDLTAIASGIPSIGAASWVANQALDLPKWKEIPARFREIRDDEKGLKQSPMGLFLDHKDE